MFVIFFFSHWNVHLDFAVEGSPRLRQVWLLGSLAEGDQVSRVDGQALLQWLQGGGWGGGEGDDAVMQVEKDVLCQKLYSLEI